jgi:uncharacterized cupredoxin-like copper-binding protein
MAVRTDDHLVNQVALQPGQTAMPLVLVDLQPGTYTVVCFIDVPEGVPHDMRGMIIEFEVTD